MNISALLRKAADQITRFIRCDPGRNADDHRFIQTVAKKHGIWFSRPGNGICHQVHLERFGIPGKTLIGSDSHTPTGGGIGMLAMGAGGLDVAVAMGGGAYYITMPQMVRVNLTGKLSAWVSAKDVILEVLRIMSVKGGVGKIIEYAGEGVKTLSVPERATITNMGAELGATTSIFPSDEVTREFLKAQGREEVWKELKSDEDAVYDEEITIVDATSIQRHTAEMEQSTFCDYVSDVDSDDEIDISDATAIQRYMADMETPYPIGVSQLSTFTY